MWLAERFNFGLNALLGDMLTGLANAFYLTLLAQLAGHLMVVARSRPALSGARRAKGATNITTITATKHRRSIFAAVWTFHYTLPYVRQK